MGKSFLDDSFLLANSTSEALYAVARTMPILDYHNHLNPKDIAEDRKFSNITEAWLEGDHYKWRAMRMHGVAEQFITGSATPKEKFKAWAKTVPHTMRNPLYHWTHLELRNYFGITDLLSETTADSIYEKCSSMLARDNFRVQGLLAKMNVEVVCTTDDPTDSLEHHQHLAKQNGKLRMFPSFRPDKAYTAQDISAYNEYIDKLSAVSKVNIQSYEELLQALSNRIQFFNELGCRSADHGLESLHFDPSASSAAPAIFKKARERKTISTEEQFQLKSAVLIELCKLYHRVGWVQQFHLGALRSTNTRMARMVGADSGFDSMGEFPQAVSMA
jgi:glucuronate isomerase